jgi:septal ring factor EnvC (AmiA/AmiB activator)
MKSITINALVGVLVLATMLSPVLPALALDAGKLEQAIAEGASQNKAAAEAQQRIEKLDDETRQMLQEFRQNTRNAEVLKTYNDHLASLLESQEKEKQSLENQLKEIEVTQREIVPLMLRMLESLEAFVSFDLPFLPEERTRRISQLKEMVVQADVTNAEKFRRILEAYQVEANYGRTIEAYRATLTLEEGNRPADFLRLGRIALYYQTLDGSETGIWDQESKRWTQLSGDYKRPVRDGLRVARKEAAPNLLVLPIPKPEAAR